MSTTTIPARLRAYLAALGPEGRQRLERDSVAGVRAAWPHRHGFRGRAVVVANVAMLRHLRGVK